jgi:hypothetical protein
MVRAMEDVFDIEDCSASSSGKKLFFFFERSPKVGEAKLRRNPVAINARLAWIGHTRGGRGRSVEPPPQTLPTRLPPLQ